MSFDGNESSRPSDLFFLPDDIFAVIFSKLNATALGSADATCKSFLTLNRKLALWRHLGAKRFAGIELDDRGMFEQPISSRAIPPPTGHSHSPPPHPAVLANPTPLCVRRLPNTKEWSSSPSSSPCLDRREKREREKRQGLHLINWKLRYAHFCRDVYEFRGPFDPHVIHNVLTPDEVAYTKSRLRGDVLTNNPEISIYIEVSVRANADNLSLALVDFDEGGKSSVTFSPDTGAVIKETKVQESPRRVQGSYIQPVKPNFTKFEGKMGLYVRMGLIAFFRKYDTQPWETTGFCVNFSWAKGRRLTPCLAFRDEGKYLTSITNVSSTPPFEPHWHVDSFDESKWEELNWEGGPTT